MTLAHPSSESPVRDFPARHLQRASGRLELGFLDHGGTTRIHRCFQAGSSRIRFPRPLEDGVPEGVLLNTAGGMTGGDAFHLGCVLGDGANAALTSQAAEKVYRALEGEAQLDALLELGAGARLQWLPQEMILFDGGRLSRRIDIRMAQDARLLFCESMVLGRAAHGETIHRGFVEDAWKIRRGDRLVYADALRLQGDLAAGSRGRATLGGGRAFATVLLVAPEAEHHLDAVRGALAGGTHGPGSGKRSAPPPDVIAGASAWDGILAVRVVAKGGAALRTALLGVLASLDVPPPRLWSI
jgi:urease accessory protein